MSSLFDLRGIKAFFFESQLHGYAGDGEEKPVLDMPGYREIVYRRDDWDGFVMCDRFGSPPHSPSFAGSVTIWFQQMPVWSMAYDGWYSPRAIPFLKTALRDAYQRKIFRGGRGEFFFADEKEKRPSLIYANSIQENEFTRFNGCEMISDTIEKIRLGDCRYFGRSLI